MDACLSWLYLNVRSLTSVHSLQVEQRSVSICGSSERFGSAGSAGATSAGAAAAAPAPDCRTGGESAPGRSSGLLSLAPLRR